MVAEIRPRENTDVRQIDEDAVDRRAIEALVAEGVEELGVAVGARVGVDVLEHGDARGGAP